MARSAVLSNGRLAVGLDERGFVNDFYYPYVGMDNMTSARFVHHKIGVWVDGSFSWLDNHELWHTESYLDENVMMSRVNYTSERLGLSIVFRDFVDVSYDFFGRVAIIENRSDHEREVRLFFHQVFQISDAGRTDTALYVPSAAPYLLTYSGDTSFVIGLRNDEGDSFDQYSVGNYGIEGKAGTYMDAEDGELSCNNVEHGGVDTVLRTTVTIAPKHARHIDYWVCASKASYHFAAHIHRNLFKNGLYHYLGATSTHWKAWLGQSAEFINSHPVELQPLIKRSLLTVKAHCDERGGVIASLDSSIYNYGRDYYSYVWPRDSYYALLPFIRLGYTEELKRYLSFTMTTMHPRGYVHHKYNPDGSMGSSWHPMIQNGKPELNIQVDETASVTLLALEYLERANDSTNFTKKVIKNILIPTARFLAEYMDADTGLPHPSYELWEQIFVTSTYTVSITLHALKRAIQFCKEQGVETDIEYLSSAVTTIEQNFFKLFNTEKQYFDRNVFMKEDGTLGYASTIDISSLFGLVAYSAQDIHSTAVYATAKAVEEYLVTRGPVGGVIRYPGDDYMLTNYSYNGNPWYIGTLWYGRYLYSIGETDKAWEQIAWVRNHPTHSLLLSEQIDPDSGEARGVSPLVWSHAEFLSTLIAFQSLE